MLCMYGSFYSTYIHPKGFILVLLLLLVVSNQCGKRSAPQRGSFRTLPVVVVRVSFGIINFQSSNIAHIIVSRINFIHILYFPHY